MRLGRGDAAAFDAEDCGACGAFATRLRRMAHAARVRSRSTGCCAAAIDDCGYRPASGSRGDANIDKFLAQARDAAARQSLDEFVERTGAGARRSNPREPDAPPEDSANAVKVMTVHSAKGLEFPVVFVAAMHKGVDTSMPVVAFSPRIGLGARWRNPAKREDKRRPVPARHPRGAESAGRGGEPPPALRGHDARRGAPGAQLLGGRRLQNWAALAIDSLRLDLSAPRDEVLACTAPDGKRWNLRLLAADRAARSAAAAGARGGAARRPRCSTPPAVGEQQDGNATVTALADFAGCPRRYFLGHYLGFEGRGRAVSRRAASFPPSELGTQVHALLAGGAPAEADPEAVRLAGVFRQSALGRRAARASRVEREFDFLMAVEDLVIRGQVDLWFEEGGELVIVDYKTDAVSGPRSAPARGRLRAAVAALCDGHGAADGARGGPRVAYISCGRTRWWRWICRLRCWIRPSRWCGIFKRRNRNWIFG